MSIKLHESHRDHYHPQRTWYTIFLVIFMDTLRSIASGTYAEVYGLVITIGAKYCSNYHKIKVILFIEVYALHIALQ